MQKLVIYILCAFVSITMLRAEEGMWIPSLLKDLNEKEMQEMGMQISTDQIYNINQSSIKDAIARIPGCTGNIVSDQGLMLTNHHCGYSYIQKHSSLEQDYLTDGFWAMDKKEELPNPGMYAKILIRIEDVSNQVLEGVQEYMGTQQRDSIISINIELLNEKAVEGTHYDAFIKPFYYGNKYYQFINETFKDIRLVGTPPSNIGKFGGDTDNWVWPRHTGDFSVFRIYADTNNKPAEYSEHNVPYKPKYHLPVSLKGVKPEDFTFIYGYPGKTEEYITSYAVKMATEYITPISIKLRTERLNIFNRAIENDKLVRIQYAAKIADVANRWKKWIGINKGIKQKDVFAKKQKFEDEFTKWANSLPVLGKKYGNLIRDFKNLYEELLPLSKAKTYIEEAAYGIEIIKFASEFEKLIESNGINTGLLSEMREKTREHFKNYHLPIDREVFEKMLLMYKQGEENPFLPDFYTEIAQKYKGNIAKFADYVFDKSIFTSEEKILEALDKRQIKKLGKDPVYNMVKSLQKLENGKINDRLSMLQAKEEALLREYMKAQMEMQPAKRFYPDANSTIRIAYGQVRDYVPMDAVKYKHFTTLQGIMEKENPEIYDYVVEDKLKELYVTKDYGQYADEDGNIHVCFIAANHTSGGNSGSPVLNADGYLLGLNFDRNWQGTMSDLYYDVNICRNITLDIRYCLFIIDKFAGAGHLIEEMTLIR